MKRLSGWDTYVEEAKKDGDRSVELPLTPDETYVVPYPTRRQGRDIARAQVRGDTDALLVALLGEEAGTRVKDLAEDQPAYVLDEFLIDVMRKFGMIPDEDDAAVDNDKENAESVPEPSAQPPASARAATNGRTNGRAKGKSTAATKSRSTSRRSSAASN